MIENRVIPAHLIMAGLAIGGETEIQMWWIGGVIICCLMTIETKR